MLVKAINEECKREIKEKIRILDFFMLNGLRADTFKKVTTIVSYYLHRTLP